MEFVSEKHFQGEDNQVREYTLGTEVMGRPAEFDPAQDAIARVEIHRLRKKLRDYYADEGAHRPIKILIPPGTYTPVFLRPTANRRTDDLNGELIPASAPVLTEEEAVPQERGADSLARLLRWRGWLAVAALGVIGAGALAVWPARKSRAAAVPSILPVPKAAPADNAVRIITGYDRPQYLDHYGHIWLPDRYFEGGRPAGAASRQFIARTSDPALYETGRVGMSGYNIPLKAANYQLKLHFAETVYGPGSLTGGGENSRVYSVTANGRMLLEGFDIVSDAGGPQIADVRVFKDIHPGPDGFLRLRFFAQRELPLVSAIEVEPAQPHKLNPIRIVTQNQAVTDSSGQIWAADTYYQGGQIGIHSKPVSGTVDPDLYMNERYGHFSYALPVAEGGYTLNLHFAETYWGPDNPGGGGAVRRVFDVYCNGIALLKNFDIFQEAGSNAAVVKTFRGLRANAQGKLNLEFVPVVNYASVFAIEVLDESR